MPFSLPFASTTIALPPFEAVIASAASITVAVGFTSASASPVRMMSLTLRTSALPIAPAGWFAA